MRTSSRTTFTASVAVALGALAVHSAPSQAQSSSGGQPSGCYQIIEGLAGLSQHFEVETNVPMEAKFQHGADLEEPTGIHNHVQVISNGYSSEPTDDADLFVEILTGNTAGSDCSDVRYRLQVLDEQSRLVTEVVLPGGATDSVVWNARFAYPFADGRFAYVSVTTETAQGRVVDTAPDAAPGHQVNLTSGGAASSFK